MTTSPQPQGSSSIRIDHRTTKSALNKTVQTILNPISSLILKPGSAQPSGSPTLTPHKSALEKCHITPYQLSSINIYKFSSPTNTTITSSPPSSPTKKSDPINKLYYFAGGGFRGPANKEHWLLCSELCLQLPTHEINIVSYPLAPANPASSCIPRLEKLFSLIYRQSVEEGFKITLMGDSAGANIALVIGHFIASGFLKTERKEGEGEGSGRVCPLSSVMAICPPTDLRNVNAKIDELNGKDPMLSRDVIEDVAQGWKGDWEYDDPRISPVFADLNVFRRGGVKIDGILAGYDVLSADGIAYREKLGEKGVKGDWLEWEKQMHCFPLMFSYHVKEGVEAKDWIVEILKENSKIST